MAYASWAATNSYSVGNIVRATTLQASGLVFQCQVAGTSAATQPTWPTGIGSTIVDGTVTWVAISSVFDELAAIAPSAIIELFQLELNTAQHGVNETYYFHAGVGFSQERLMLTEDSYHLLLEDGGSIGMENNYFSDIVWDGQSYLRFPIEADGFEWNGTGQLPRPTLRVSNIFGTITGLILSLPRGIEGAKVTRLRTLVRYLDAINFPGGTSPYTPDPAAEFPREIYYVDRKAKETRELIELELAAVFDLVNVRAPKRQCSNFCPWEYRGPECNYTGTAFFNENDEAVQTSGEDKCGKRLSSCILRFAQTVGQGTVVVGSQSLVLDDPVEAVVGAPIKGFGVVPGFIVSSVTGNVVTMSAGAVASSFVSGTGTLNASDRRTIVFSGGTNPPGLQKGMLASGPNVVPGTTIESFGLGASSLLLSQPVPWNSLKVAVVSHTGILRNGEEVYERGRQSVPATGFVLSVASIASVAVGQYVIGPGIPASANARVQEKYSSGNYWDPGYSGFVVLSFEGNLEGSSGTYTFYTVPLQSLQTYTFTVPDRSYTFKDSGILNFGGFPGIGSYYA